MKLYHGTSFARYQAILQQGLLPRAMQQNPEDPGQFEHTVVGSPRAVYLTDAYALHFAFNATDHDKLAVVIEIETDLLRSVALVPDEDVLEQIGRGADTATVPMGDMKARTAWYRDHLHLWAGSDHEHWRISLDAMGTCAYMGPIPPFAFSRVMVIPTRANAHLRLVCDPQVSVMNYKLCGERYKRQTAWLFGDPLPDLTRLQSDIVWDQPSLTDLRLYPFHLGKPGKQQRRTVQGTKPAALEMLDSLGTDAAPAEASDWPGVPDGKDLELEGMAQAEDREEN